jgi:hypothetical protein
MYYCEVNLCDSISSFYFDKFDRVRFLNIKVPNYVKEICQVEEQFNSDNLIHYKRLFPFSKNNNLTDGIAIGQINSIIQTFHNSLPDTDREYFFYLGYIQKIVDNIENDTNVNTNTNTNANNFDIGIQNYLEKKNMELVNISISNIFLNEFNDTSSGKNPIQCIGNINLYKISNSF